MVALVHLFQARFHVVAQIVEAKFVVGRIGDIRTVSDLLLAFRLLRIDNACCHPKGCINLAHPFRVAPCQIIVDGHHMHALAHQGVQIGGKGRDKGLALACLHLGDVALMQKDAAHQLRVEGAKAQGTPRTFAAVGECFGQNRIKGFAILQARLEFCCLVDQPLIRQGL